MVGDKLAMPAAMDFTVENPSNVQDDNSTIKNISNYASDEIFIRTKKYDLVEEQIPKTSISYTEEMLINLVPNADYTINGVNYTADNFGKIRIEEGMFGTIITIVKKGDQKYTKNSQEQKVEIVSRQEKPNSNNFTFTIRMEKGKLVSRLCGMDDQYEYSLDKGTTWIKGDGSLILLPKGTNAFIRKVATHSAFASNPIIIEGETAGNILTQTNTKDDTAPKTEIDESNNSIIDAVCDEKERQEV